MTALLFLFRNIDHFRRRLLLLMIAGAIDGALLFSVPLLISLFLRSDFDLSRARSLIGFLALAISASLVLQFIIRKRGESIAPHLANHLRLKIFSSLESLSLQQLNRRHSGQILSLTTQVADGIGGLASTLIWLGGHAGVTLSLFFIMTARESPAVSVANAVLLALFMLISLRLARRISQLSATEGQARAVVAERFADVVANLQTIKRLSVRSFANKLLKDACYTHNEAASELQAFHALRWGVLHGVFYISFLITIYCLLLGVATGRIAAPMMVIFISAFTSVRGYLERLSELVKQCMELGAFLANASEILPIRSDHPEIREISDWTAMQARDVSFSYSEGSAEISVSSFTLRRGDIITITGESGQGKSTLLLLLAGLLAPTSGHLTLDTIDYQLLPSGYPARLIASVSQETELFNLSIRSNLALHSKIADETITSLLAELGLHEWLASLPLGLDTLVGEKGLQVSAGQKQRLSIARALLLNRPILFLDEPTSHLDTESEQLVIRCLARYLQKRSAIIVSHRHVFSAITTREMIFEQRALRETS